MTRRDPTSARQPAARARHADYRRIADDLRGRIAVGDLAAGACLPSIKQLAATWKTSFGTVHNAIEALSREGWVERIHGSGTFVTRFKSRFDCAGIYHFTNIYSGEQMAFARTLHDALVKQLHAKGKETMVFLDTRPRSAHRHLLPALQEAILHRRVQCVFGLSVDSILARTFENIKVPIAFTSHRSDPRRVRFDLEDFLRQGVRQLAAQGCHSVGLISHILVPTQPQIRDSYDNFYPAFRQAARELNMTVRESWIRPPEGPTVDPTSHGYHQFKNLWALREKPDGLVVHPDVVVRGMILGALEVGMHAVQSRMKFVLHRNSQTHFLCPFPATWGISSEEKMARELITMIEQQFKGEQPVPVSLGYTFEKSGPIT